MNVEMETGFDTAADLMEFPEAQCREAQLTFLETLFPLIFGLSFAGAGIGAATIMAMEGDYLYALLFGLPFGTIGLISLVIFLRNVLRYVAVALFGKEITGKVYGYMEDVVSYNGVPGRVCKLLVQTANGPKFIMYQPKGAGKPYAVNTEVPIKVYKDRFKVLKPRKYEEWM